MLSAYAQLDCANPPQYALFEVVVTGITSRRRRMEMTNPDQASREGTVTVRGAASGFAQTVQTRSHRLSADEPLDFGGSDTGPTPYELLLAALGA